MKLFFRNKPSYILMHKELPVLKGDYSFSKHGFREIREVMNEKHLPIGTTDPEGNLSLSNLNQWIRWRGIPAYRVGLYQLQTRLEIEDPLELLEREYSLSVSDTYWLKEETDDSTWASLNFFHRNFDQSGFGQAMFSLISQKASRTARHTPNNTTCGYHRKAWFHRNGELYLLKGGSPIYQQEPVNEWLASQIARRLGMDAVTYDTELYENNLVSACKAMTDEHTDLVPAKDVIRSAGFSETEFQLPLYMKELKKHGIRNAEKAMNEMMIIDYLLMNSDRHSQNLAILRDADTGEWKQEAPVFDSGTGLGCLVSDDEILQEEHESKCQLFNAKHFSHERLLDLITLKPYDLNNLEGLPREYGEKLLQYQPYTGITNKRINDAYKLFYKRINALKKAGAK